MELGLVCKMSVDCFKKYVNMKKARPLCLSFCPTENLFKKKTVHFHKVSVTSEVSGEIHLSIL